VWPHVVWVPVCDIDQPPASSYHPPTPHPPPLSTGPHSASASSPCLKLLRLCSTILVATNHPGKRQRNM
jgi:hypothetical protein